MKSLKDTITESMQLNESSPMIVMAQSDSDRMDICVSNGVKVFATPDPDSGSFIISAVKDPVEFLQKTFADSELYEDPKDLAKAAKELDRTKVGEKWSWSGLDFMIRVY